MYLGVSDPTNLAAIDEIKFQTGCRIDPVVVEQDIAQAMAVADRVYCMMEGRVTLSGSPDTLSREDIHDAYFGASH